MDTAKNEMLPIFLRLAEGVKDYILMGEIKEGEQLPSTPQLSKRFDINITTVNRAYNVLINEGLVFKKRGIGMFVAEGAVEKLISQRRAAFAENYIVAALKEAKLLRYTVEDLQTIVAEVYETMNMEQQEE